MLQCFNVLDFFFSDSSDSVYLKGYCGDYVDPCHDENDCNCVPVRYRQAVVKLKSVRGNTWLMIVSKFRAATIDMQEAAAMITRTQFPAPSILCMLIPETSSCLNGLNNYGFRLLISKSVYKPVFVTMVDMCLSCGDGI